MDRLRLYVFFYLFLLFSVLIGFGFPLIFYNVYEVNLYFLIIISFIITLLAMPVAFWILDRFYSKNRKKFYNIYFHDDWYFERLHHLNRKNFYKKFYRNIFYRWYIIRYYSLLGRFILVITGISFGFLCFITITLSSNFVNFPPDIQSIPSATPYFNQIPAATLYFDQTPPILMGGIEDQIVIPFSNQEESLPHNGLFMRRNNQFGTRATGGITDLISQGIFPDQIDIRLDDFVALDVDGVPQPADNQSIAFSYGITAISDPLRRDERATHYLEVALRTSTENSDSPLQFDQPSPINFIIVIDTSGSMEGEKLNTVKASIRELFLQMRDIDTIAIIQFSETVQTVLEATPKESIGDEDFARSIASLAAEGGTDINLGLNYGISESYRFSRRDSINRLYLFSDGNPTSGETNWISIRQNVAEQIRGENIHISTFGFGSDANVRELNALAGISGGESVFVTNPQDILLSVNEEFTRRDNLTAINIQLLLEINDRISILHFYGHDLVSDPITRAAILDAVEGLNQEALNEFEVTPLPNLVTEDEGIRLLVPDLATDETYFIVLELAIPSEVESVGQLRAQYIDTSVRENRSIEFTAEITGGELADETVLQHALGLWTSEIVYYALDDLYVQDLDTATARIEAHIGQLNMANNTLNSAQITDDIVTLRKFVSLAENLGQILTFSDASATSSEGILVSSLNEFGRVHNGIDRLASTSP